MSKWERILFELFLIGLQIYLDIQFLGPLIDEVVELGVSTLNSLNNPLISISFILMFNIIAIIGWIDLIREILSYF